MYYNSYFFELFAACVQYIANKKQHQKTPLLGQMTK